MRLALVILLTPLAMLYGEAVAQRPDMRIKGSSLLEACTKTDYEWIGFCNGYIQAAFDANFARVCAPKGATRNQLYDVVIPTLQQAPELLQSDAVWAVGAILSKAYPCK